MVMEYNILKIFPQDVSNGEGIRVSVWCSGCSHNCKGCHNPETAKKHQGTPLSEELIERILKMCEPFYIKGLTISGGDPLDIKLKNYEGTMILCKRFKEKFPEKDVWVWTGENYEDLKSEWLNDIDVVIDGEFKQELKDISLQWRGSSNQRVIRIIKG